VFIGGWLLGNICRFYPLYPGFQIVIYTTVNRLIPVPFYYQHNLLFILSKKYELQVWAHKTSLTLPLLKVPVASQESDRACVCESGISICRLDFETVLYVLIFNLFIKYREKPFNIHPSAILLPA
jgi:hypothetical protein